MPGELQKYEVEVNGTKTTLKLSDEDAKARGLTPKAKTTAKKSPAAANKKRGTK